MSTNALQKTAGDLLPRLTEFLALAPPRARTVELQRFRKRALLMGPKPPQAMSRWVEQLPYRESPRDGTEEGKTNPAGLRLRWLDDGGEPVGGAWEQFPVDEAAEQLVLPLATRLARERGLKLSLVSGKDPVEEINVAGGATGRPSDIDVSEGIIARTFAVARDGDALVLKRDFFRASAWWHLLFLPVTLVADVIGALMPESARLDSYRPFGQTRDALLLAFVGRRGRVIYTLGQDTLTVTLESTDGIHDRREVARSDIRAVSFACSSWEQGWNGDGNGYLRLVTDDRVIYLPHQEPGRVEVNAHKSEDDDRVAGRALKDTLSAYVR